MEIEGEGKWWNYFFTFIKFGLTIYFQYIYFIIGATSNKKKKNKPKSGKSTAKKSNIDKSDDEDHQMTSTYTNPFPDTEN